LGALMEEMTAIGVGMEECVHGGKFIPKTKRGGEALNCRSRQKLG
jgi:hypothetical protein